MRTSRPLTALPRWLRPTAAPVMVSRPSPRLGPHRPPSAIIPSPAATPTAVSDPPSCLGPHRMIPYHTCVTIHILIRSIYVTIHILIQICLSNSKHVLTSLKLTRPTPTTTNRCTNTSCHAFNISLCATSKHFPNDRQHQTENEAVEIECTTFLR